MDTNIRRSALSIIWCIKFWRYCETLSREHKYSIAVLTVIWDGFIVTNKTYLLEWRR
jgi:hypothetical protein